jgi:hypothetical protein
MVILKPLKEVQKSHTKFFCKKIKETEFFSVLSLFMNIFGRNIFRGKQLLFKWFLNTHEIRIFIPLLN